MGRIFGIALLGAGGLVLVWTLIDLHFSRMASRLRGTGFSWRTDVAWISGDVAKVLFRCDLRLVIVASVLAMLAGIILLARSLAGR